MDVLERGLAENKRGLAENERGLAENERELAEMRQDAKRRRVSITTPQTVQQQGEEQLRLSCEDRDMLQQFSSLPQTDALQRIFEGVEGPLRRMQAATGGEGRVQEFLRVAFPILLGAKPETTRVVSDTSRTGLPLSTSAARPFPDMVTCHQQAAAPNVEFFTEAKPQLSRPSSLKEVVFQMHQRVRQLMPSQPGRSKWVGLAIGSDAVEVWFLDSSKVSHNVLIGVSASGC